MTKESLSPSTQSTPLRIIVAEDEALIRLDLIDMLKEEGYQVIAQADNGQRAVDLTKEHKPDLVIMDIKMPGRDGLGAAQEIAQQRLAPVVILTAFSQRDFVEKAQQAGAIAYLVKPFSKSDLVPTIEIAVSRYQEMLLLHEEIHNLNEQLETRKILERAKGIIMSTQHVDEPQAFRTIQRAAMDRRVTMKIVAQEIINLLSPEGSEGVADAVHDHVPPAKPVNKTGTTTLTHADVEPSHSLSSLEESTISPPHPTTKSPKDVMRNRGL